MKALTIFTLSGLLLLTLSLSAQNFIEVTPTPFTGVRFSALAFADVNGDGYQDVLITGQASGFVPTSKLYLNDGAGNFTEQAGTPFDSVIASAVAFADVNGDGHQDVLIAGVKRFSDTVRIAKLYLNDGGGLFTEMMDTPFDGVWFGSVAFMDVNGSGCQDVLIVGRNNDDLHMAKLYTNDGSGNFTEMMGTPFKGVWYSSVVFSDFDSDGHPDVLIVGQDSAMTRTASLYTNDGLGNFLEKTGTSFAGSWEGAAASADVNGDGHQDIFMTGLGENNQGIANLYMNDGLGNFTEQTNSPFEGVWRSAMAFVDANVDGYPDILLAGRNNVGQRVTRLYINDGSGNFIEKSDAPFDGFNFGEIIVSEVNGDEYPDILIAGESSGGPYISKLYLNNGQIASLEAATSNKSLPFTLYPNPATSPQLYIQYPSTHSHALTVHIFGLDGRLIRTHRERIGIGEANFSIDVASLPAGRYALKLDNGRQSGVVIFTTR